MTDFAQRYEIKIDDWGRGDLEVSITYAVPWSRENLLTLLQALHQAVGENWMHTNAWSPTQPERPIEVERWLSEMMSGSIERPVWLDEHEHNPLAGSYSFYSNAITTWISDVSFWHRKDDEMSIYFSSPYNMLYEYDTDREKERLAATGEMDQDEGDDDDWEPLPNEISIGETNRQMLLHIAERLYAALPVKRASISKRLITPVEHE